MAESGFDDYEMKEQEQEQEMERIREEAEQQELQEANRNRQKQETNFDNIDDVVVDIGGKNDKVDLDLDDLLDDIGKDTHNVRRATTNNIKKVFKSVFDISIEKKNGKSSKEVLENTKFVSSKNGRISIEFKGSRIGWVERNLNVNLFEKKNKNSLTNSNKAQSL